MNDADFQARWALAVVVARGRMAGGWVPVDADLVLALQARLQAYGADSALSEAVAKERERCAALCCVLRPFGGRSPQESAVFDALTNAASAIMGWPA